MHCLKSGCTHVMRNPAKSPHWVLFQLCACCLTHEQSVRAGLNVRGRSVASARCKKRNDEVARLQAERKKK